jgi:hypothetical protein
VIYSLAIDPGVKILGWALFFDGRLIRAGISETKVRGPHAGAMHALTLSGAVPEKVSCVAVELMMSYELKMQKGDQNDLIDLASIGSYVAGRFQPDRITYFTPAQWKGQMPKNVSHRRIEDKLFLPERAVLSTLPTAKTKRHNAMDAIGIGLCDVGRRA